jgi:hypothetical protein
MTTMSDEEIIYQKGEDTAARPKPDRSITPTDPHEPDERPPGEQEAEAELLETSGGDPFTQESD